MPRIIITAPSLDPSQNVSGVSSVVQFIVKNNRENEYIHFQIGKSDAEHGVLNRIKRTIRCFCEWRRVLRTNKGCIVHYSFPLSAPSILRDPLFMLYAKKKGFPLVVHVHGGLFLTAHKVPFALDAILKWVFSWNVPFIALSENEKQTLKDRFGAANVEVLPNCPDIPHEMSKKGKKERPTPLVLGYLGRIEPNKGMTELLQACETLKNKSVPFQLLLAGKEQTKDEYIPLFQKRLKGSFCYQGLVSGKEKEDFLQNLDILAMPTYFEGLPMSLLESMGYGVVPVITGVGSIPIVVTNHENGLFIKVKDVDSIVTAIMQLDNDRELLTSLSHNAQVTIRESFSPEHYISSLNQIYKRLVTR